MNALPPPLPSPAEEKANANVNGHALDARLMHLVRHIAHTTEGKALLAYLQAYKAQATE